MELLGRRELDTNPVERWSLDVLDECRRRIFLSWGCGKMAAVVKTCRPAPTPIEDVSKKKAVTTRAYFDPAASLLINLHRHSAEPGTARERTI
jgi:hypothetical protein